eukprot:CAMPEP_0194026538 /NCGR_PEP_ID=MMETSP0009_2-20130614/839_1 /TAXON_ID=210454 /ORGANISM="Grammatophora oceanica, Strain CCMP 410" /LENGTH=213 /DNA_ID=CAMNT_0038665275 /DNA_START=55 /DNA_END=696 /DNA_ORIENTATION=-
MKTVAATTLALVGSAAAFQPFTTKSSATVSKAAMVEELPGVIAPTGFWDPLGLAAKADEATLKRYREAEITHGRVAMLATVGFLVGEKVEGSSFLWDASIKGPAIDHFFQVPHEFWSFLVVVIGAIEIRRAQTAFVPPEEVPVGQAGLMRESYTPGDLGWDPLSLSPEDPLELQEMKTKELQHGRLAMLAAAGFLAQEAVDGQGILEHLASMN